MLQELGVVYFSTCRRSGISGLVDLETRHRVTWGTRRAQVEMNEKDMRHVGSDREEWYLKAPGSLVFKEGGDMGNGGSMEWRALNLESLCCRQWAAPPGLSLSPCPRGDLGWKCSK